MRGRLLGRGRELGIAGIGRLRENPLRLGGNWIVRCGLRWGCRLRGLVRRRVGGWSFWLYSLCVDVVEREFLLSNFGLALFRLRSSHCSSPFWRFTRGSSQRVYHPLICIYQERSSSKRVGSGLSQSLPYTSSFKLIPPLPPSPGSPLSSSPTTPYPSHPLAHPRAHPR